MKKPLATISLVACLGGLSAVEIAKAQAKQQCSAAMPSNPQGRLWSYRIIDGRKCWYEGKPMLSKSSLEWTKDVVQTFSNENTAATPRNALDSQAWAPPEPVTFEALWRARVGEYYRY
ncbi:MULTISPECIES: hypothetical protein [unclassified Bradyrhizobium]|uniref:hypothetical protein n=1 Tax=unclassified Bradyrhizobium TaxID=2631580 RepID=UPI001FFB8922|nr:MULTISPECIES: hypothetical protein [unclassified Bradyrhizobium]